MMCEVRLLDTQIRELAASGEHQRVQVKLQEKIEALNEVYPLCNAEEATQVRKKRDKAMEREFQLSLYYSSASPDELMTFGKYSQMQKTFQEIMDLNPGY